MDEKFTIAQGRRGEGRARRRRRDEPADRSAGRAGPRGESTCAAEAVIPGLIDNHMHLLRAGTTVGRARSGSTGVESRKQALDLFAARAKAIAARRVGVNDRRLVGRSVRRDSRKPFTSRRARPDRPEQSRSRSRSPIYRTYLNSRGLEAFGIRDERARPAADFRQRARSCATRSGRATGVVEGGMGAVRAIAAKMPRVPARRARGQHALAMIKDMNRAGLTAFGVAGLRSRICVDDVSQVEGAASAQRPHLLHRRRGRRNARAGGSRASADRAR